MRHRIHGFAIWTALVAVVFTGCQPTQPIFFMEDGDLSHYLDVATEIEYPDVEQPRLAEVDGAQAPLTLDNFENYEIEDLALEDVIRMTMENSQVMRQIGGLVVSSAPETISRSLNSSAVVTTWDPALVESGYGGATGVTQGGTGVEAALSEFDAVLSSSVNWQKNKQPRNTTGVVGAPPIFAQDAGAFSAELSKTAADGTQLFLRNNTAYDLNNTPAGFRPLVSDWTTNFEAGFSRPLLQGGGTQYNRIAGPHAFSSAAAGFVNQIDGVVIARIRHDMELTVFESGVQNILRDAEASYWELYFAYRNLESQKAGLLAAQATWSKINELRLAGERDGAAHEEGRARAQFYLFQSQVQTALTQLLRAENRMRYIMGLSASDGRLFRPSDEPTKALLQPDWTSAHCEALARRWEIRKKKWELKKREMEMIAARNHLLPRLDVNGQYRWLGLGDDLAGNGNGIPHNAPGSSAFDVLTDGQFQEWSLGLQFTMPLGMRQAHTEVRHHQLLLARERALLQDLELEVSHQLADAFRDIVLHYKTSQTNFNRRVAAQEEVLSYTALAEEGTITADVLLDSQRRRFDAEVAYYRSLVDYNIAIVRYHERKGSLLDYNGVQLAEGPWPAKAYFDALRRARKRDASIYLDYGYSRPDVISRGPIVNGGTGNLPAEGEIIFEGPFIPDGATDSESIPTPAAEPEVEQPMLPADRELRPGPGDSAKRSTGKRLSAAERQSLFEAPSFDRGASNRGQVQQASFETARDSAHNPSVTRPSNQHELARRAGFSKPSSSQSYEPIKTTTNSKTTRSSAFWHSK